jgi:hypothetical protein
MADMDKIVRMNSHIGTLIQYSPVHNIEIMPAVSVTDIERFAYFDDLMQFMPPVLLQT